MQLNAIKCEWDLTFFPHQSHLIAFIFYSEKMRFTLENSWKMILKDCVNHDLTLLWRFYPIFSLQFWVFWRYKQLSKKGLFLKLKVPFFQKKIRREGAPPPRPQLSTHWLIEHSLTRHVSRAWLASLVKSSKSWARKKLSGNGCSVK